MSVGLEQIIDFPTELLVFSLPVLGYVLLYRWRGSEQGSALDRVGWRVPRFRYFTRALGLAVFLSAFAWVLLGFIPPAALRNPMVSTSTYAGLQPTPAGVVLIVLREAFYTALGEELFFRGLVAGVAIRRFGFLVGNAVQTLVFLAPHLLLLMVDVTFWPIVVLQLVGGWVLGWLYHRSESVLPGWVLHSILNTAGALAFITTV